MKPINNTPIELYTLGKSRVYVKREDLCAPSPGPGFSKMRGVYAHIAKRPEAVIGVLDTLHSKAGWAVSCACSHLGKRCVNFWPRFKADGPGALPVRPQQQIAQSLFNAKLVQLQAGRSSVLYHQARKILQDRYPGAYLMPNALKLPESVEENGAEAFRTFRRLRAGTLVLSLSSGTVATGVLVGLYQTGFMKDWDIVLHMGYSRSEESVRSYMAKMAGWDLWADARSVRFVDERYGYSDAAKLVPPFPANPYYDAKAWEWLSKNLDTITETPILFWSIGD